MSWLEELLRQGSGTVPGSGSGAEDSAPRSVPSLPHAVGFNGPFKHFTSGHKCVSTSYPPTATGGMEAISEANRKKINLAEWKVIALK